MKFPKDKKFAFTIIDDTDGSTVENTKPIYDFLHAHNIFITKTVWTHPSQDKMDIGKSLKDNKYLQFIKDLKNKGFEIALHGPGNGSYKRDEVIEGLGHFRDELGEYPTIHINHSSFCLNNMYWGSKRFVFPINWIVKKLYPWYGKTFYGEVEGSPYFWGDYHKKIIKYTRNFNFSGLNLLKEDTVTPYVDSEKKKYSNYWFSSTFTPNSNVFNKIVHPKSIDKLESEGGVAILYTHLAGFFRNGEIDQGFLQTISYLSKKDGWFVPANQVLDFLLEKKKSKREITIYQKCWFSIKTIFARYKFRKLASKV
jgi:hypothetical protein